MSLSKKIRFEVFKRDSFTCQYCGKAAPDVILHVDHIEPRSKGGSDDIINLVTSCRDCNLGKSNRKLDDDAVIKQRKRQLDELQERREQLEMMMDWQRSLIDLEALAVEDISSIWSRLVPGYHLNDTGIQKLRGLLKTYKPQEIIRAMRLSVDQYVKLSDGKPIQKTVDRAFNKVSGICYVSRQEAERPYLKELYYIRGILRNRLDYVDYGALELMESVVQAGVDVKDIATFAKKACHWSRFESQMEQWRDNALGQD